MSITKHYFVMKKKGEIVIVNEPLSTVNPLIRGAYSFQAHLRGGGGGIETGGLI